MNDFFNFSQYFNNTLNDILQNIYSHAEISGNASFTSTLNNMKQYLNNDELKNLLDLDIWNETIELQDQLNKFIDPNWKNKNFDWFMAIIDEETEILNSKNWKWWKDTSSIGKINKENIIVELIDIFHFLLSIGIEKNKTDFMYILFSSYMNTTPKEDFEEIIKITRKNLRFLSSIENFELYFIKWLDLWFKTGKDLNYLFKYYRVKSALNILRQTYGYKNGEYKKIWDKEGNEDNFYAWKFANELELNKDMYKKLYKKLEKFYLQNVDI